MLIGITVRYSRSYDIDNPDYNDEDFTVTYEYMIKNRVKVLTVNVTPVLLAFLQRQTQSGHYKIGIDAPGSWRHITYKPYGSLHTQYIAHYDLSIVLYPAYITWCNDCYEILTTPSEIRSGMCSVCQHYETELYIAKTLVGAHLLADDEEQYYKSLLD